MLSTLKNWNGKVVVNGTEYENINAVQFKDGEQFTIKLVPKQKVITHNNTDQFVITVKQYMTRKATPEFNFMAQWNNDIPMPLRTMVGEIVKETRGMVYMKLHADIISERTMYCMRCGKPISNPVSQYFGMGPECGKHGYVNPFNSEQDLKEAVRKYREELKKIEWEGWIIKSAITESKKI